MQLWKNNIINYKIHILQCPARIGVSRKTDMYAEYIINQTNI